MANTGVLPFVRGIDFSNNDFEVSIISITKLLIYHIYMDKKLINLV